jgi:hypothetical protein
MSMSVCHYVGYYFKCNKQDNIDQETLFPDESMFRVYDEGGSEQINDFHIYIPNRQCAGCYSLDEHSETGLLRFSSAPSPDLIIQAEKILCASYESIELRYGVVSYVN